MNVQSKPVTDTAAGVNFATTVEGLSAIRDLGCSAAIWQRQPRSDVLSWIETIDPETLPSVRVIIRPDAVRATLEKACDDAGTPDGKEREALIEDVAILAEAFARVMQAPYLRLRLDIVTTNACRRFHIDALMARLVCTYRGTGTQYGTSINEAEPEHISTVPTGAPIVLRGTLWPTNPETGLLHRSPPIEGTGESRSVLVLDPIYDLEEED